MTTHLPSPSWGLSYNTGRTAWKGTRSESAAAPAGWWTLPSLSFPSSRRPPSFLAPPHPFAQMAFVSGSTLWKMNTYSLLVSCSPCCKGTVRRNDFRDYTFLIPLLPFYSYLAPTGLSEGTIIDSLSIEAPFNWGLIKF